MWKCHSRSALGHSFALKQPPRKQKGFESLEKRRGKAVEKAERKKERKAERLRSADRRIKNSSKKSLCICRWDFIKKKEIMFIKNLSKNSLCILLLSKKKEKKNSFGGRWVAREKRQKKEKKFSFGWRCGLQKKKNASDKYSRPCRFSNSWFVYTASSRRGHL